jgi:tRNA(Arg) A34 adenosine deaminase TadA
MTSKRALDNIISKFKQNVNIPGIPDMLALAAQVGLPSDHSDLRGFWIGCVGIRKDGVLVSSKNGAVFSTSIENYQLIPSSHAEGRVLRKVGYGATLFVGRVSRKDGILAMARPCAMCSVRLSSFKVEKAYYTIDPFHYGVFYPRTGKDRIFRI